MNAPAAGAIVDEVFEHLPLTAIAPSQTHSQIRRRKRYTPEAISEFAQNLLAAGVMQPIIVRRLAAPRDLVAYELVAGERRWLSAKEAGFAHIPALVRDVPERDLVLLQFSENKHREGSAPLEEAEALRDLMKDRGIKADEAAELIGMKTRHVYNRLKLLTLKYAGAIEDLETGTLDHTKALQIARYPSEKTQKKAYELVGDPAISLRQATEILRDKLMVRLDSVPFDLEDATMENANSRVMYDSQIKSRHPWDGSATGGPALAACTACPNYSGNDPELDEQITGWYGVGARACTDKPCHDFKVTFFFNRRIDQARRDGRSIIEGPEAKLIRGPQWQTTLNGYIDLDAECVQPIPAKLKKKHPEWNDDPTYRQVLGDREELKTAAAVLIDPFNKQPRDILPVKDAKAMLNGMDIDFTIAATPRDQPNAGGADADSADDHQRRDKEREAARLEAEKQAAREEQERVFRRKLLALVHEKWKGPLKRDELQAVCDRLMHDGEWPEFVDQLYGGDINTSRMKEPELARLVFSLSVGLSVDYLGDSPELLIAAAKRFKIDPAKVRKQVKAELGGVEEPAVKKPAAKKKSKKK